MASFMSMQYDSDSDSADDLDFEPVSDGSSGSGDDSAVEEDMDETMEGIEGETGAAGSIVPAPAATSTKASASKKKSSPRAQQTSATVTPPATAASLSAQVPSQPASMESTATPGDIASTGAAGVAIDATTESLAGASGSSNPAAGATGDANTTGSVPGEVVKKKKGPKKGTKYKKRATAAPDAGGVASGKAPKTPKMTKKAAAAAAAAAAAVASQNMAYAPAVGRFAFQNTQVDLDHPLQSFKWPYSPFTADFKTQHQLRGTMAKELHQAVQQITEANNRSTWHLQELDQQLQMSRQDLKTSLDEIQFRKSQLRDMSLMAVDIVRKLSSSSSASRRSGRGGATGAGAGMATGAGAGMASSPSSSSSSTSALLGGTESAGRVSDLDSDAMEVDGVEDMSSSAGLGQLRLNELNESNVRSFLEKIRELEQHQRYIMV
ncbi:hypothetical protein BG015_011730 [Linnemannia schmuckeri]|uniref:Uncharacterized protein n=1 Tax=Linnemannia schmuckeri TaxID=64567 RepID=A0A9P5RVM9_9FUNG|nr:hypothetical protein BG015_011730 [Linnemannia schmuckeri]